MGCSRIGLIACTVCVQTRILHSFANICYVLLLESWSSYLIVMQKIRWFSLPSHIRFVCTAALAPLAAAIATTTVAGIGATAGKNSLTSLVALSLSFLCVEGYLWSLCFAFQLLCLPLPLMFIILQCSSHLVLLNWFTLPPLHRHGRSLSSRATWELGHATVHFSRTKSRRIARIPLSGHGAATTSSPPWTCSHAFATCPMSFKTLRRTTLYLCIANAEPFIPLAITWQLLATTQVRMHMLPQ